MTTSPLTFFSTVLNCGSLSAITRIDFTPSNHRPQSFGNLKPHFSAPATLQVATHLQTRSTLSASFSPSTMMTLFPFRAASTMRGRWYGTRSMLLFESPKPQPNLAFGSGTLMMNVFLPSSLTYLHDLYSTFPASSVYT